MKQPPEQLTWMVVGALLCGVCRSIIAKRLGVDEEFVTQISRGGTNSQPWITQ